MDLKANHLFLIVSALLLTFKNVSPLGALLLISSACNVEMGLVQRQSKADW
jgi:hypothetical protein